MAKGWEMIRGSLKLGPNESLSLYLGCVHRIHEIQVPIDVQGTGMIGASLARHRVEVASTNTEGMRTPMRTIRVMQYDMSSFLESCVEKYTTLVPDRPVHAVPTPYLADRRDPIDPELIQQSPEMAKREAEDHLYEIIGTGLVNGIGAQILMKLLYAARMARPDLLRAIQMLASRLTKWSSV